MIKITSAWFAITALSFGAVFTGPSYAQATEKAAVKESKTTPSAEAIKAASRILEATRQLQQIHEEMQNILKFQTAMKEGEDKELLQAFDAAFSKKENIAKLQQIMAEKIASHFSIDDLQQLAVFFESPLGRRFSEKQIIIVAEAADAARAWGRQLGEETAERLKKK